MSELTSRIDDHDAIVAMIQLYIDGSADGDAGKLKEAFHEEARMFGAVGEDRYDVPIQAYFELATSAPANVAGNYRARILGVQQVGDAATVTVAEDGCWGTVSFVDFFSLTRIGAAWKIVTKTFAHTGGEMPHD